MTPECRQHEDVIVDRVKDTINEKVEFSVTKKMKPVYNWITGTILAMLSLFLASFADNRITIGRMQVQTEMAIEYMKKQDQLNKNLSEQLTKNATNLLVIALNMRKVDSTFTLPPHIWQLRGSEIKD